MGHFTHAPIPHVAGFLLLGVAAVLCGLAAFGWGAWPVYFLLRQITQQERTVFSLGLGWGILSLGMMGLGTLHAWTPTGVFAMIALGTALGVWQIATVPGKAPALPEGIGKQWLWLMIPAGILGTLLALAPPTYYDSLVYHLALPAAYIRAGHWIGWTDLIYSGFPQNLEMLWTLGLLTGLSSLPGIIGWMLALLLLRTIYHACQRYLDAPTGSTAVAFLLVMPAFLLLSSGGYVDIGLALYFFLSVYALSLASSEAGNGPFLLAGFFAGFATGIKYTGILSVGLGLVWILCRRSDGRLRSAFIFSAAALLVFAPWMVKNLHYFGNPVFPFFYTWGKAALNPWMQSGAQGYFRALVEYQPHSLLELPALLWNMAVNGFQFGKGADVLGDFGWALFIAFLPLVLWVQEKNKWVMALGAYALLFFACWGMTRPVLRFLFPIAPLLAILAAYGWTHGIEAGGKRLRYGGRGVLAILLISNFMVFFQITDVFKPFRVPLGLESKEEYLTEKLTYYGAASFINRTTDPNAEIVVVGDQRSYYYERKVLIWTVFKQNPLVAWADQAATPSALRAELRHHGALLVVNRAEMQRLAPYHALDFSPAGEKNWEGVLNAAPRVYRDRFCDVYTL